jgi:intracellular sulfur oxidation DsrE/DsrF family protein
MATSGSEVYAAGVPASASGNSEVRRRVVTGTSADPNAVVGSTGRREASMEIHALNGLLLAGSLLVASGGGAQWPAPAAPVIPEADGYVVIPKAEVPPDKTHVYRAVFDATRAADTPGALVPALNQAGSELNALGAAGVRSDHAKFVIVFHGSAIDGILDDAHYRARFGVANPNLKVIAGMRKAGVRLLVCGQNLAFAKIDPATLTPDVQIASDALIVLMTYQNKGYALLSF